MHVDRSERSLAVSGSLGVFAVDAFVSATKRYNLETVFELTDSLAPDKPSRYPALARRLRIHLSCIEESGQWLMEGPLNVSVERKWHAEGFSLDVAQHVNTAPSSKATPSGLGLDEISSAVAAKCFLEDSGATGSRSADGLLSLPFGLALRLEGSRLQVSQTDGKRTERVLLRDFLSEGPPQVTVIAGDPATSRRGFQSDEPSLTTATASAG